MKREAWIPLAAGFFLIGVLIPSNVCRHAFDRWGIAVAECPDGDVRQTAALELAGLRRGVEGQVYFEAIAHYTTDRADRAQTAPVPRVTSLALSIVDGKQHETPLAVEWERDGGRQRGTLKLPELPDGDYKLRARYETKLGTGELDAPLPLFTPARIHVMTDRPLYEPGNVVKFRAVVLRARDLGPIDGRPGMWTVKDPTGEVLLEEKAAAGDWGVVAGSFPLDRAAAIGTWKVAWVSSDATDEVAFTVQPFTLPRFRVEASASQAFYQPGDRPQIKGAVVYSSGAPVARANLEIQWDIHGGWPPPAEWQDSLLPKHAVTSATGRFELSLPEVPDDLQGQVTLTARISAVDPAGDRVAGATQVLLAKDGIAASVVTELGDGLVQSFNNRLFVRVTTPDGRVVAKSKIKVKRTWQPSDPGVEAELDEDGVASLQIDPGAPVNIVIPAQPWRPAPRAAVVSRGQADELIGNAGASLADQVEFDRWLPALAPCAKWVGDDHDVVVGMRVDELGKIVAAGAGPGALDRCVVEVLRGKRLPGGTDRLYRIALQFTDPDLPALVPQIASTLDVPAGLAEQIAELARGTRDCLPTVDGVLPNLLAWRVRAGEKTVELTGWAPDPLSDRPVTSAMACVQSRIAGTRRLALADKAATDSLGVVRFRLELPERLKQQQPQPTTMVGYELSVEAQVDGKPASTKLRIKPGTVPDLRLRVTPVVAKPGETITAQLIRGPEFRGKLPDKLELACLKHEQKVELDPERKAAFVIDPNVEGWCTVRGGHVHAYVYVPPKAQLEVAIAPKQPQYAPGQRAELVIQTKLGGQGGKAAVGLFGVDDSLGQLVPLPGPDAMARIQPQVQTSAPAFASSTSPGAAIDGQALATGRVRGANAAAATVLRVSAIPAPPELDSVVTSRASSTFDPVAELTDHFYLVLAELHAQTRQWEAKAPVAEKMRPATMAALWQKALAACKARGEGVTDAFGRPLRLSQLPPDLLALTDPRAVIVVGTRLPEDVENWAEWVARERP